MTLQTGNIIKYFPNYANADPVLYEIIKVTAKKYKVRLVKIRYEKNKNGYDVIRIDFATKGDANGNKLIKYVSQDCWDEWDGY